MPIPHRPPATGNLRYRDPASQCARIIDNQTLSIEFRIESSAEYYFCVPQYPLLLSIWRYGFLAEYPSLGDRARSGPTAVLDAILLLARMHSRLSAVARCERQRTLAGWPPAGRPRSPPSAAHSCSAGHGALDGTGTGNDVADDARRSSKSSYLNITSSYSPRY